MGPKPTIYINSHFPAKRKSLECIYTQKHNQNWKKKKNSYICGLPFKNQRPQKQEQRRIRWKEAKQKEDDGLEAKKLFFFKSWDTHVVATRVATPALNSNGF